MKLRGKRAAVLVQSMHQELQLWVPYYRLIEEGADVIVVGPSRDKDNERFSSWLFSKDSTYTSSTGYPVRVDAEADALSTADLDAVIIPGGYAADRMRLSIGMVQMVRSANDYGKVVASIGHGGWMLTSADIVRGKRVTSAPAIKDDLIYAGATWLDEEVVVDGNLITARAPEDLPAFCRRLVGTLANG